MPALKPRSQRKEPASMNTITIDTARQLHPDCEVFEVIDRAIPNDPELQCAPAIHVWATEADAENDDGAKCVAIYWLVASN